MLSKLHKCNLNTAGDYTKSVTLRNALNAKIDLILLPFDISSCRLPNQLNPSEYQPLNSDQELTYRHIGWNSLPQKPQLKKKWVQNEAKPKLWFQKGLKVCKVHFCVYQLEQQLTFNMLEYIVTYYNTAFICDRLTFARCCQSVSVCMCVCVL